jgi:hypothetical protein
VHGRVGGVRLAQARAHDEDRALILGRVRQG